jgi:hypothetical protein
MELQGSVWVDVQQLTVVTSGGADLFGQALDLSGDRLLISALGDQPWGPFSGSAFVFEWSGASWSQTAYLIASDGVSGHDFGWSLALDGDRAVLGALGDDDAGAGAGAMYAFSFDGGAWHETSKIVPSGSGLDDAYFGESVALRGDVLGCGAAGDPWPPVPGFFAMYEPWLGFENYCASAPNSAGPGCLIRAEGSSVLSDGDLRLVATGGPPGQYGTFFYGFAPASIPFGDGVRCIAAGGQGIFRLRPPVLLDPSGAGSYEVDFDQPPVSTGPGAFVAGTSVYAQFWYRDPAGPGGSGFNLSDAVEVAFCP